MSGGVSDIQNNPPLPPTAATATLLCPLPAPGHYRLQAAAVAGLRSERRGAVSVVSNVSTFALS